MDARFTVRSNTWTALDTGVRIVEWIRPSDAWRAPRPSRFQEQQWSDGGRAWVPTGTEWADADWDAQDWWNAHSMLRRGPLPCFVPEEEPFLFLGTVRAHNRPGTGAQNDEGPEHWPCGRYSMQHQCAGGGMAQADLDGAFFVIPTHDASPLASGLRALTGPYEGWGLTDAGADEVAAKAGALLQAAAFPSNFDAPCGEALHWFHLDDGLIQRIASAFQIVSAIRWQRGPHIGALTQAPFSSVAELSDWRGAAPEMLVAALVYENCD